MRSFEVPGIGGIGLFPDTPDHRDNFTEGEELFLYSDVDDCSKKAIKLLDLPKERAMTIRNNALSRCRRSGYSYKHRTRQLLEEMQRLL